MKVGLTSESIAITEGLDIYAWILRAQAEMNSRWKLSDITLISTCDSKTTSTTWY